MTRARNYSSVNVDLDRQAKMRAAVQLVREVTGQTYTVAAFVRDAFDAQLRMIQKEYNDGRPIPPADPGESLD